MSTAIKTTYKAILVDFFDTLILRHVTARDVLDRWAECLRKKYPVLSVKSNDELTDLRLNIFYKMREELLSQKGERTEVTYEEALGVVYDKLMDYGLSDSRQSFITISKQIDLAIEIGCDYVNRKLLRELKEEKAAGKRLFLLSDFYLSENELRQIMRSVGIPQDFFEQVYVSCDIGRRKAVGDAFAYVLAHTGLTAEEVKMIGDNKKSDNEMPDLYGIRSDYRPNIPYKFVTHLNRRLKRNFGKRQSHVAVDEMYKHGMEYSEYINMFYIFTKRLHENLQQDRVASIAFMAREGFYLKDLFELYQSLSVEKKDFVKTDYYWCSRRSVMAGIREALMPEYLDGEISLKNWLKSLDISLEEARVYADFTDEDADLPVRLENNEIYKTLIANDEFRSKVDDIIDANNTAFREYTKKYITDDVFRFVDSGWKCTTQNTIQASYGIGTVGYYIGVQKPDKPINELKRTGLIFSEEKPRSQYYDFLGTNIPFYQQLLAAPHGTALKYIFDGETINIKSEWDPMEEALYHEKIEGLQEYMRLKFMGLCAWDDKDAFDAGEDWFLAKSAMRSSLFAHGNRLKFIRECTDNYVQNFRQENRGKVQYDASKAKIRPDVIWKPEKYLRYISKIQRTSLYDHQLVRIIYPAVAYPYYFYTVLVNGIKKVKP